MEANHFNKNQKHLTIGDFVIACDKQCPGERMEIPFSGMAFYQPRVNTESDFCFSMDYVEPNDSGKQLFGSDEFHIPTFLYERENGEYDWITKKGKDERALSFRISNDWTKFTLYEDNTHTNGDRCLCRKKDGIWYAYGMPWAGSSGEYINRKVPITAIVSLKQDSYNHVRRMNVFEGSIYLLQRIFAPLWRGKMQERAMDMTEELAREIPMLELSCKPDFESVDVLKEAILALGE